MLTFLKVQNVPGLNGIYTLLMRVGRLIPGTGRLKNHLVFDFVITEVADPDNSPDLQFIDLYTTKCKKECHNKTQC